MLAAQHGPRLVWLGLLSICLRSSATDVQWQISIAWEDENCDAVCASNGLACTEACWPNTARGLENALRSSGLHSTCFGVEAGSPNPWHPAKDPENTMCYWFGGHTASDAPRCPLTPATPAAMLENSRVIRRLCPCISGNSTYGWLDCGLDGEPMDPAPTALGWIDDRAATTTSQPTPIIIPPGEQQPAPAPPQVMPGVPACQELCAAGFAGEDEFLNGRLEIGMPVLQELSEYLNIEEATDDDAAAGQDWDTPVHRSHLSVKVALPAGAALVIAALATLALLPRQALRAGTPAIAIRRWEEDLQSTQCGVMENNTDYVEYSGSIMA
eukprot:s4871_g6.t1